LSVYFNESKLWRYVVTNRQSETLTLLDRLASERKLTFTLGGPAEAAGRVPSDNPSVNIPALDGDPFVEEGVRFLYALRREEPMSADPWVCRFAGIIQQLEDSTRSEDATSAFVAYDPWQYLFSRPCRAVRYDVFLGGVVSVPGATGVVYRNTDVGTLLREQLGLATLPIGTILSGSYAAYPLDSFYLIDGDVDLTMALTNYQIQQGTTVGQLLQDFVSKGLCDVTIDPVYDPVFFPGILGAINIIPRAGQRRNAAMFSWDKPKRNLVGLSRMRDGTRRANVVRGYGGQGGAPTPTGTDVTSQTKYGVYEEDQFFPEVTEPVTYALATALAQQEVDFRKDGLLTYTVSPAAERSPMPLRDYGLGDWMPLYWSMNFRQENTTTMRVMTIPIELDDNGLEVVQNMLVVVTEDDA
jgi:hypothetical protein